jgi:hypothetical protein
MRSLSQYRRNAIPDVTPLRRHLLHSGDVFALLLLAAVIAVTALLLHHRHWRRGAAGQYVLASLPAALLFVILPIPVVMFSTVRGFQAIAREGRDSYSTAPALTLEINRALWLGMLGVLATMTVAALLQWRADRAAAEDSPESVRTWRDWILIACAMLVLPTGLLVYIADEVPRTMITVMESMMTGASPRAVPPSELGAISSKVATLLITGVLAGAVLAMGGMIAALGAVFAASGVRQPRRPSRLPWVLVAIVLAVAAWNAVRLPIERRWMERVAAATAHRDLDLPQTQSPRN